VSCDVIISEDNILLFYFSWKLHSLLLNPDWHDTARFGLIRNCWVRTNPNLRARINPKLLVPEKVVTARNSLSCSLNFISTLLHLCSDTGVSITQMKSHEINPFAFVSIQAHLKCGQICTVTWNWQSTVVFEWPLN
jgi:hypothetical protein